MSKVKKTLTLPVPERLKGKINDEVVHFLRMLVDMLQLNHRDIWDSIESGGISTKNWTVREATAADVTAGNAAVAGNLIVVHKTSGTKFEHEA